MKHWSKTAKIIVGLVVLFVIAQAFHPKRNNGSSLGPKDITHVVQVPDSVLSVFNRSCFNCHSNNTHYWWYDKITPVNYWINSHIEEGQEHLNFSTFTEYSAKKQRKKLDEVAEQIEKDEMPLGSYTFIHTEAKLTEAEKKMIIDWAHQAENSIPQP